jgi:hypothetical protein
VRATFGAVLDKLAATDGMTRGERERVAGLQYAVRIADR